MSNWYLATYQNGAFLSDLDIIKPDGNYAYKLKNPIANDASPQDGDWLRITIEDNTVKEWDGSSWIDTTLSGLEEDLVCWVYGISI